MYKVLKLLMPNFGSFSISTPEPLLYCACLMTRMRMLHASSSGMRNRGEDLGRDWLFLCGVRKNVIAGVAYYVVCEHGVVTSIESLFFHHFAIRKGL